METRTLELVHSVSDWNADRNCTVIQINFECQSYQACLDSISQGNIMKEEICKVVFGSLSTAKDFPFLVGVQVYALRAFPYHWASIEGIGCFSFRNRIFTKTGFRKRHLNDSKTALDYQLESRRAAIAMAQRRIADEFEGIEKDEASFVDWERP